MKKILVVDDNTGILNALRMALTMFGHEVRCELNATDVLETVAVFKPDIIILDLFLSGESGTDVCTLLKNDPHALHIPIIMMSAHPSAQKMIQEAGADDFLPKPFDLSFLMDLVKKY